MTKRFPYGILLCLLAALPLVGAMSCRREDDLDKTGLLKSVRLALSVSANQQGTKADVSAFTELNSAPVFRGMTDIKMVAFKDTAAVTASDRALNLPISVPAFQSLLPNVPAIFYSSGIDTFIPIGTSRVLLYGRAPGEDKTIYGSLVPKGFDTQNTTAPASSLGFAPDAMYSKSYIPDEAGIIARVVNAIMTGDPVRFDKAKYYPNPGGAAVYYPLTMNWNETVEDSNLKQAYLQITNEGAIIPGSGPMVESMLSSLYAFLKGYESQNSNAYEITVNGVPYELFKEDKDGNTTPLLYKDILNGLRDVVLGRMTSSFVSEYIAVDSKELTVSFIREDLSTYPESLGLPSGSAVLRWTPTGFTVPLMSGVEGMAPLNRYCYPTALYYYTDTGIVTSQDENIAQYYSPENPTDWSEVTAQYKLGTSVTSNTLSVALLKPVQYAVGMLSATVKSDRDWLQDNDGLPETTVQAIDTNLRLTGIILSRQFAQNFEFSPIVSAGNEYFSYDSGVSGVYLTKGESAAFRTLSLPTPEDENVFFTLEFLNNSGKTFYGADGRVLPGRKFYMVGKMELPTEPTKRLFKSVFVKDHITTLSCTIKSLAGAYNAVPDLGIPQLVIGVQTQVNWDLSTPVTVIME